MKKLGVTSVLIAMLLYIPLVFAGAGGTWTTIDDKTGKKRAVASVSASGDSMSATIIKTFPQPGDTGLCHECPGAFKGKKVVGMTFMWGLKKTGENTWDGGKIIDPKTGKIYRAKVTLEGNKLYVRGYVGVSLLGRTQVWVR